MQLITTVNTNPSIFFEVRQEWHHLLENSAVNEIFMTPEYQSVWWQTLGRGELHIVCVRLDSGRLVGLAPLFIENGTSSFIGCKDVSDYLDFIVHNQYQDLVYQSIIDELKKISKAFFSLCSIQETSPTLAQLPMLLADNLTLNKTQQDVCPQISLPTDWESYLQMLERKQRHELKRKWRKIEETENVVFECISAVNQVAQAVPISVELHTQSSETKREFWDQHCSCRYAHF